MVLAVAAGRRGSAGRPRRARIGRAHAHPGDEIVHLRRRELSLGRHPHVGLSVAHRLDEQALLGIAGDDGRAADAALFPAASPVEGQPDLRRAARRAVALVAVVGEDRPDLAFEELELILRRRLRRARGGLRLAPTRRDPKP